MKSKKEKIKITALAAAASILLTGAGVEPKQNNVSIENSTGISMSENLGLKMSNMMRNDLLLMRINNFLLTQMKNINDKDKIKQIIENLIKIVEKNKVEITSITYKYNNNGTHTITIKYINKETGKEETKTTTSKCTYENNSNKCKTCGHIKKYTYTSSSSNSHSHTHNFIEISEEIISNNNGTHKVIHTYECPSDNVKKTTEETKNCTLTDWIISEDKTMQTQKCLECDYTITKPYIEEEHKHSNPPTNLEYKLDSSNNDSTHTLKGTYTCTSCNEEVQVTKVEACNYTTTGYEIFSTYNSYNEHDRIDKCNTCGYENKVREGCTKTGEKQYIKINSTIYEYYDCEFCKGYVDRTEHKEHTYGEWEIDSDRHIRYCGCVEGREEGQHEYSFSPDPTNEHKQLATCDICGYTKSVLDHEHAHDEMSLLELIENPYYSELISKSQIANPNPSPDDYCSKYDLRCSTCGMEYSIYYSHKFQNGACTRTGYCGGILDPNYTSDEQNLNDEIYHDSYENTYDIPEETNQLKLSKNR